LSRGRVAVSSRVVVRGYQRDTVYYSVLEAEWPAVKARLEARLAAGAAHLEGGATSARVRPP